MKDYSKYIDIVNGPRYCKNANARWALFDKAGKMLFADTSGACHGSLNNHGIKMGKGCFIVTGIQTVKFSLHISNSDREVYLDWLMNKSPYQSCFISKDAGKAFEDQAIVVSCDVPSNLMAGALMSTRRLHEFEYIVRFVAEAIGKGLDGTLAYALAHMYTFAFSENVISFKAVKVNHSHQPLSTHHMVSKGALANFLSHKPQHLRKHYSEEGRYGDVTIAWGGAGLSKVDHALVKVLQAALSKETKTQYKNPFATVMTSRSKALQYDFKKFMDRLPSLYGEIHSLIGG